MDYTNIFELMILLLFALVANFFIPWLRTKVATDRLILVQKFIDDCVYAAGKLKETGVIADKAEYVKDKVSTWLATMGIKYDMDRIGVLLEASVKKLDLVEEEMTIITTEVAEVTVDDDTDELFNATEDIKEVQ